MNRIKEQQLDLVADRTSARELRVYFSAFAGIVIEITRRFGLTGTELARAQARTIGAKLLKIAGPVRVTTRRIWISLSSAYPWQILFWKVARRLLAPQQLHPTAVWRLPALRRHTWKDPTTRASRVAP